MPHIEKGENSIGRVFGLLQLTCKHGQHQLCSEVFPEKNKLAGLVVSTPELFHLRQVLAFLYLAGMPISEAVTSCCSLREFS